MPARPPTWCAPASAGAIWCTWGLDAAAASFLPETARAEAQRQLRDWAELERLPPVRP
jgi:hypothetical protein